MISKLKIRPSAKWTRIGVFERLPSPRPRSDLEQEGARDWEAPGLVWGVPLDKMKILVKLQNFFGKHKKRFSKHQKVFRKLWKHVSKIPKRKFSIKCPVWIWMPPATICSIWLVNSFKCTYFGLIPFVDIFITMLYTSINYNIFITSVISPFFNLKWLIFIY